MGVSTLPRHSVNRRFLGWGAALALALTAAHLAAVLWPASAFQHAAAADALVTLASLAALGLAGWGAWRSSRASPALVRVWLLIAAAQLAAALGEIVRFYVLFGLGRSATPLLVDLLFLVWYALLVLAVLALPKAPLPAAERLPLLLDTLILMTAAGLMLWTGSFVFILRQAADQTPFALFLRLIYPAGNVVLLWAVTAVVARRLRVQAAGPIALLALSIALALGADMILNLEPVTAAFRAGHWPELAWTLSYAAAALGGLWQAWLSRAGAPPEDADKERGPARPWSIYLAYGWLAAGYGLLIVTDQWPQFAPVHNMALYVNLLLTGLVLVRQVLILQDNRRLYAELWQEHALLDARVQTRTAELAAANRSLELSNQELESEIAERRRNEIRLRLLSRAVEQSPATVMITDAESIIEYVNPAFTRITGYDLDEVVGQTPRLLASRPGPSDRYGQMYVALAHGAAWHGELQNRKKNGESYWAATTIAPITDDSGYVTHFLNIGDDVTERKRAEQALRDSEARFRAVFESAAVGIGLTDLRGRVFSANAANQDLLGYSAAELADMTFSDFTHPDDAAVEIRLFQELITGQRSSYQLEKRYRQKSGREVWGRLTVSMVRDAAGAPQFAIAMSEDITERKQAEEALRQSEARLRAIFEGTTIGLAFGNTSGGFVDVNPALRRILGYSLDELKRLTMAELTHPDDLSADAALFAELLAGQRSYYQLEKRYLHKDGHVVWAVAGVALGRDAQGLPEFAIGVIEDITERKRAEAAEREQRALADALRDTAATLNGTLNFDALLDEMLDHIERVVPHDGASIVLVDGQPDAPRYQTVRSRATAPAASRPGPSQGRLPALPPDWIKEVVAVGQPVILDQAQLAARGGWPGLGEVGAYLGMPIYSKGQVIGVLNLTSRAPGFFQAAHGQRLAAFAAQAAVAIENARLYERVQRQAEEIGALYRASAKLLDTGGDIRLLAQQIALAVTLEFGQANCGLLLLNEAGSGLTCVASAGDYPAAATVLMPLDGPGLTVAAFQSGARIYSPEVSRDPRYLARDPRVRSQLVVPLDTGWRLLGVLDLQSPEPNAFDERVLRIVTAFAGHAALALDSARLLVQLEDALRRANHLAEAAQEASRLKSEFLANTSHELRTPLTGILGSLSLVMEDLCETPAEERQFVNTAYLAARHLLHVINDILDIAKIEAGRMDVKLQSVDIREVLDEVRLICGPDAAAKRLELCVEAPAEPGQTVLADPNRLRQIMLNLVGNAVKFTPAGRVTVRVTRDPALQQMHIEVQDTGMGIPSEQQGRLFQPFVQLDGSMSRKYGGTGLGLSIARHLAELMNGRLTFESAGNGQGSTFRLSLPVGVPLASEEN